MSLSEIKKPFNLIMFIIAIVAVCLSILFYFAGQKKRIPVYQITEPYSMVYDSSASTSKISVLDSSGKLIQDNIFLITISFWNAGNLPIEPDDVRSPLIIHIGPISRILDFSIITQTDPSIVQFSLNEIPQSSSSTEGQLHLSWIHLDPGEGVRFQVIYVGPKDAIVSFSGHILDVDNITNNKPSSNNSIGITIPIVSFILLILYIGILIFSRKIIHLSSKFINLGIVFFTIFSGILFCSSLIVFITQISAKPPF